MMFVFCRKRPIELASPSVWPPSMRNETSSRMTRPPYEKETFLNSIAGLALRGRSARAPAQLAEAGLLGAPD